MADEPVPPTVDVHYIKRGDFREFSCDGAIGGLTPNQKLWLGFYSERLPIPRMVRQPIVPTDKEGEYTLAGPEAGPVVIDTREGLVRNMEFGVYMSLETAERLRQWLDRHIKTMKDEGL